MSLLITNVIKKSIISVAKVIEIVASLEKSFDDAVQQGLAQTANSLRGISGLERVNWTADIENNQIVCYSVTLHVAFQVEYTSTTPS